ncbi:hypothetical protein [Natronococcus pandeyae]|uniref:hypothetical protein n=1 Tax=Natronococcus pandeyae TaxID=2055836 RepID=UPI00165324A5|nr:hypothetical protein [Natronococcus pandeyae]
MTDSSRRGLLCGTAGLLALTAGCVADDLGGSSSSADTDDGDNATDDTGSDDGGSDDGATDGDETEETEVQAFRYDESAAEPNAALFFEREHAEEWLEERRIGGDSEDAVSEFVDETPFQECPLAAVEAGAPNLCYELIVESVTVEDGTLDLEAVVSDEASDEMGCAQQETTVGALVRASDDGEPVDDVSVTVVDREGTEHELARDSDSDGDEGSESDSPSDNEEADDSEETDDSGEEETAGDSDDE